MAGIILNVPVSTTHLKGLSSSEKIPVLRLGKKRKTMQLQAVYQELRVQLKEERVTDSQTLGQDENTSPEKDKPGKVSYKNADGKNDQTK